MTAFSSARRRLSACFVRRQPLSTEMQAQSLLRVIARWSELIFAVISLLLWSTLPLPPTRLVMWNWILLTISVILGIAFFVWLKAGGRNAWLSAAAWALLAVADIALGIIRNGGPSWTSAAVGISFVLVYSWGFAQLVVLSCSISWWLRQRSEVVGA